MRIFIAGATGVLGRRLVRLAADRGHEAVGLARTRERAEVVARHGGTPVVASLFDADALAHAIAGSDVVVHGATSIPTETTYRPESWAMNDRIRREGTTALTQASARAGVRRYIQQSIVWVVQPPGGAAYDEASPPNAAGELQSAVDAERIAAEAASRQMTVAVLRCGAFYAADAGHTLMARDMLKARKLPVIGRGRTIWAWVHADDVARAFLAAAEGSGTGIFHVVDDDPSPAGDVLDRFAELLGAPRPRRVPAFVARLFAGAQAVKYLTTSMNTTNHRFKSTFRWTPAYPSYREGLTQVVQQWQSGQGIKP